MSLPVAVFGPLMDLGKTVIDRVFPDKISQARERAEAELKLAQLTQDEEFRKLQAQLSTILAEAQSSDPWTSRARPAFLYVIYILLLTSLPIGILSAFKPDIAAAVAQGMKMWLAAIPEPLYALFAAGYLGYSGFRSWDKKNGVAS